MAFIAESDFELLFYHPRESRTPPPSTPRRTESEKMRFKERVSTTPKSHQMPPPSSTGGARGAPRKRSFSRRPLEKPAALPYRTAPRTRFHGTSRPSARRRGNADPAQGLPAPSAQIHKRNPRRTPPNASRARRVASLRTKALFSYALNNHRVIDTISPRRTLSTRVHGKREKARNAYSL